MSAAVAEPITERLHAITLELHQVLTDIDAARLRGAVVGAAHQRLVQLQQRIVELAGALANAKDERFGLIKARLSELANNLRSVPGSTTDRAAWKAFRERVQPVYESLADALAKFDIHVPSLRPTNYLRNALHVGTGLLAIAVVWLLPGTALAMVIATALAGTCWSLEISRRIWPSVNSKLMATLNAFAHPHESFRVNSATWYMTAVALLTYTQNITLIVVSLAVLGFGDPAAALVGRRWGRIKLINGRSLEGSLTFVAAGTLAAMGALAIFGSFGLSHMVWLALGSATLGAVVELVSRRIDDNLSVPVAAGAGFAVAALLLGLPL